MLKTLVLEKQESPRLMNKKIFNGFYAILMICSSIIFLAASCQTEDDNPLNNQEAHTSLRCKINGTNWEPAGGDLFSIYPFNLQYYEDTGGIELIARRNIQSEPSSQAIYLRTVFNEIDVEESIIGIDGVFVNSELKSECTRYDLDTTELQYIRIMEIDTIDFFIIGEFQFSAYNECNDTIRVSEGYFDLKYIL